MIHKTFLTKMLYVGVLDIDQVKSYSTSKFWPVCDILAVLRLQNLSTGMIRSVSSILYVESKHRFESFYVRSDNG